MSMRCFTHYHQRITKLDFLGDMYQLFCENGVFTLFDASGNLYARSCKSPFKAKKHKQVFINNTRQEDRFQLLEHSTSVLMLVELSTKIVQDYLVVESGSCDYNETLFIYCCRALSYHGYSPKGLQIMVPDTQSLSLSFGRNEMNLKIENCCVVYQWGFETNYAKHVYAILNDLGIKQYRSMLG